MNNMATIFSMIFPLNSSLYILQDLYTYKIKLWCKRNLCHICIFHCFSWMHSACISIKVYLLCKIIRISYNYGELHEIHNWIFSRLTDHLHFSIYYSDHSNPFIDAHNIAVQSLWLLCQSDEAQENGNMAFLSRRGYLLWRCWPPYHRDGRWLAYFWKVDTV